MSNGKGVAMSARNVALVSQARKKRVICDNSNAFTKPADVAESKTNSKTLKHPPSLVL